MPLRDLHSFFDCGWSLEPLVDPQTGKRVGTVLVIFDQKEIWKLPLIEDEAKKLGMRLAGIEGKLEPANVVDMAEELKKHGGKRRK